MPFTIGGDWIPEPTTPAKKQSVKVYKEKRRGSYVTLISGISPDGSTMKKLCSELKQKLACGGSVKEDKIELQGDQVDRVKLFLNSKLK